MTKLYTQNTPFRIGLFTIGWLSNGVMWMPLFHIISAMFPLILPSFAMLSLGCFGGASLAIKLLPKHYLTRYSGLIGGFLGGFLGYIKFNLESECYQRLKAYSDKFIINLGLRCLIPLWDCRSFFFLFFTTQDKL